METTGPRLFRILLEVSDTASAAAFYAKLLAVPGREIFGGRQYYLNLAPISGSVLTRPDLPKRR